MDTSPLAKFTYGTFDVQKSPTKVIKRPGQRLGPLAIVKHMYKCPSCDKDHEVWTILILAAGAYMSTAPIFRVIEDAANFVLDVVDLIDWSTADAGVVKRNYVQLLDAILLNKGLPLVMVKSDLEGLPENLRPGVPPGTQGYNGYGVRETKH